MKRIKIVAMWYCHKEHKLKVQLRNMDAPHGVNPYKILSAKEFMLRLRSTFCFDEITTMMDFVSPSGDMNVFYHILPGEVNEQRSGTAGSNEEVAVRQEGDGEGMGLEVGTRIGTVAIPEPGRPAQ